MAVLDFKFVRAADKNRAHVLELLTERLPGTDPVARHRWLHESNPHGRALTVIAYDAAGAPAAMQSVFPRHVLVDGKVRLGAIGGDGYVRPAYRGQGLTTALHRSCLVAMKELGIGFVFGPPEPDKGGALIRAGAREVTELRRYARPRFLNGLLCRAAELFSSQRVKLSELEPDDRRVAEVWEEVAASRRIVPVRDAAHYEWRYRRSPSQSQRAYAVVQGPKTIALCAIERRAGRAAIVDLLAPEDRYAAAAGAVAAAIDAEVAVTRVNASSSEASGLLRAGFLPRESKPFQVLAYGGAGDALFEAGSWHYTWGDGDVDRVL